MNQPAIISFGIELSTTPDFQNLLNKSFSYDSPSGSGFPTVHADDIQLQANKFAEGRGDLC